jgi:PST family polysaccharide transporter
VSSDGLGAVAARGAFASLGGQVGRIAVQLASIVVLARLLDPRDYGLVALVTAVIGVGEIFRDFGLSAAAVQAPTLTAHQRDNLFWANTGIGAVLAACGLLASGVVAAAFDQPALEPIMRVLALTFLLNGLATQYRAGLQRSLRFGRLAAVDVTAQVAGLLAGVAAALAGWGYWALVGQQVAVAGLGLVLVVAASRWWPGRPRRETGIRRFLRFGWQYVGSQVLGYAAKNADTLVIGHRFGPVPLGVYNRAYQLLMGPLGQVRAPTTTVALPVLARLQDDEERYGSYLLRGQAALGYTFVPGIALAAGAVDPLVAVLLGPRWAAVAPLFAVLAFAAVFETLPYVGFWVYMSRGLTGALLRYTLASSTLKIACIVVGSTWGTLGVAAGYAVGSALNWPLSWWRLSRLTPLPLAALVREGARILAVALCAGLAARAATVATSSLPAVVELAAALTAAVVVYAAAGLLSRAVRADLRVVYDIAALAVRRGAASRPGG